MAAREDIRVATIPKNKLEELRITLTEYRGHDLVDLRVFMERAGISASMRSIG